MAPETHPDAPAIEFRDVTLDFDDVRALDHVSFRLDRGETIIVTGVSGCGKSVLVRLACGLERPTSGQIFLGGHDITTLDEDGLLELRSRLIGFVFQQNALFTGISTYENTAYRLVEHQWPLDRIDAAVTEILTFVGLDQDADKLPEELSIGMRRRLEIARALVGWPPIMLYDEPTSGLDPINARQVMDLVIRARDIHRISSLYVTKEMHEIPYLARHRAVEGEDGTVQIAVEPPDPEAAVRVTLLDEGRIEFTGTAEEFLASQLPVALHMTHPELERAVRHA